LSQEWLKKTDILSWDSVQNVKIRGAAGGHTRRRSWNIRVFI